MIKTDKGHMPEPAEHPKIVHELHPSLWQTEEHGTRCLACTKMGFTQILQNSSGGSIVIDAFHDQIGYHVVLSSEGKATLTRHNSDKNAEDTEDQLQIALSSPLLSSQSSLPIEPLPLEQTTREVLPESVEPKSRQAQEDDELRDRQGDIISESDMS